MIRIAFADGADERVRTAATTLSEYPEIEPLLVGRQPYRRVGNLLEVDAAAVRGAGGDDPLHAAAALVADGRADVLIAGATRSSREVVRVVLDKIGLAPNASFLTSAMLVRLRDGRVVTFSDCAVVPEPTAPELAQIALAAAEAHAAFVLEAPVVAMLSFSTFGSASHPSAQKVRQATTMARSAGSLVVHGEVQFDVAFDDTVGRRKSGRLQPMPNVFIFPSLDAGNIGLKIAEQIGGAGASGPFLLGCRAPASDLSRGTSVADIVSTCQALCDVVERRRRAARATASLRDTSC